jgi:hypothetical protein
MKHLLWIAGLVVTWAMCPASVTPAVAQQPSGFGQFAWGTPRDVVADTLGDRCSRHMALDTVRGRELLCYGFELEHVGPVVLTLEFADGTLQGYGVTVPHNRAATLRSIANRQFGEAMATALAGGVLSWSWPSGERALFDEHCLAWDDACLIVRTSKIVRAGVDAVDPKRR